MRVENTDLTIPFFAIGEAVRWTDISVQPLYWRMHPNFVRSEFDKSSQPGSVSGCRDELPLAGKATGMKDPCCTGSVVSADRSGLGSDAGGGLAWADPPDEKRPEKIELNALKKRENIPLPLDRGAAASGVDGTGAEPLPCLAVACTFSAGRLVVGSGCVLGPGPDAFDGPGLTGGTEGGRSCTGAVIIVGGCEPDTGSDTFGGMVFPDATESTGAAGLLCATEPSRATGSSGGTGLTGWTGATVEGDEERGMTAKFG